MNPLQRALIALYATAGVLLLVTEHVFVTVSLTESLPQTVFVVVKGAPVERGDLLAYRWSGGAGYPEGALMVKRRAGLPGDPVYLENRDVFVADVRIGHAKEHSRRGVPLVAISPGVIPAGHSFVAASHPDSLDSRYAITGLIADAQIIGRAYALH